MVQSEWVVMAGVAMAFLMLGWLGFIVVIWGISVIGLIREGIRFFLQSSEQPAAWWELSETDAPSSDQGSGGPSRAT